MDTRYFEEVDAACAFIKKKANKTPELAIVLGSGLGHVADDVTDAAVVPYAEIPHWPRSTAPGHEGKLVLGTLCGRSVAVMRGRIHYYEGYSMREVTFPVRALGALGVKALIVTNASGAVNKDIEPGSVVAIEDHINMTGTNPLIGENYEKWGPRFPDMTYAYDREFLKEAREAAAKENIKLARGVYAAMAGPSFETPAEVKMLRLLGADVVGMSTVPEVITARHMGIRVLALSCAANGAAGISDEPLTHEDVLSCAEKAGAALGRLIERFVREAKF